VIAAFLAEVQHLADERTPDVFERVFARPVPVPYCHKCLSALIAYTRVKVRLHHLRRRARDNPPLPDGAHTRPILAISDALDEAERLRHTFYTLPCECGQREEYVYPCGQREEYVYPCK